MPVGTAALAAATRGVVALDCVVVTSTIRDIGTPIGVGEALAGDARRDPNVTTK